MTGRVCRTGSEAPPALLYGASPEGVGFSDVGEPGATALHLAFDDGGPLLHGTADLDDGAGRPRDTYLLRHSPGTVDR